MTEHDLNVNDMSADHLKWTSELSGEAAQAHFCIRKSATELGPRTPSFQQMVV